MIVAFDVDDTLWKVRYRKVRQGDCVYGCEGNRHHCENYGYDQVPDYDLIQVLRWFHSNGDKILVWSAGGIEHAQVVVDRLGLDELVEVVAKGARTDVDITFDDQSVVMGATNVKVKREGYGNDF